MKKAVSCEMAFFVLITYVGKRFGKALFKSTYLLLNFAGRLL